MHNDWSIGAYRRHDCVRFKLQIGSTRAIAIEISWDFSVPMRTSKPYIDELRPQILQPLHQDLDVHPEIPRLFRPTFMNDACDMTIIVEDRST
jgi:hypothetical protein